MDASVCVRCGISGARGISRASRRDAVTRTGSEGVILIGRGGRAVELERFDEESLRVRLLRGFQIVFR